MSLLGVTQLADASAWAVYAVGALLAVGGAAGVVLQRNPVHCALGLVTTIFGIALLFIDQGADFLAAVQIIVYAGAIVILFLFVIMLLGVDRKEDRGHNKLRAMTPVAVATGIVALVELLVLSQVHHWATGAKATTEPLNGPGENVQKLGQSIFTAYLLPFEMTSALLVIAVVAAVVLVRRTAQTSQGQTSHGQTSHGQTGHGQPGPGPQRKGAPGAGQPARVPAGGPSTAAQQPAVEQTRPSGAPGR